LCENGVVQCGKNDRRMTEMGHFRPSWPKRSLRSAMPPIATEFTRHDRRRPEQVQQN
jgi:hypothetical protein